MVRHCLDHGAPADYANEMGTTALHMAAATGRGDVVSMLLQAGARPNAANFILCTPLHVAADVGDLHVCRLLLDHGADATLANEDGDVPADVATVADVVEALAAAMPDAARAAWEQRRAAVFEQPPGLDDDDVDDDGRGYMFRPQRSDWGSHDDGEGDRPRDEWALRRARFRDTAYRLFLMHKPAWTDDVAWSPVHTWLVLRMGASVLLAVWARTRP